MSLNTDIRDIEKIIKQIEGKLVAKQIDTNSLSSSRGMLTVAYRQLQKLYLGVKSDIRTSNKLLNKLTANSAAFREIDSNLKEFTAKKVRIESLVRACKDLISKASSIPKSGSDKVKIKSRQECTSSILSPCNISGFIKKIDNKTHGNFLKPALGKKTSRKNMSLQQKTIVSLSDSLDDGHFVKHINISQLIQGLKVSGEEIEAIR